jgi:membrane associated rhomboid family serine protease
MLPLSDGMPVRRFPIVNVSLIVANFAVWIFYELPHLNSSIFHASFYPCTVNGSCHGPESWGISWITAMFMHGSWDHILGNMLFLAVFGKNVEDAFGPLRYLAFYFAGGFAAMMTQTAMTLLFGTGAESRVPNLGASGAIAAVLGAYFVLYPRSTVSVSSPSFPCVCRPRSSLASGSYTSCSKRTSGFSPPGPTAAASRSSPMSAASSSERPSLGCCCVQGVSRRKPVRASHPAA